MHSSVVVLHITKPVTCASIYWRIICWIADIILIVVVVHIIVSVVVRHIINHVYCASIRFNGKTMAVVGYEVDQVVSCKYETCIVIQCCKVVC